MPNPENLKPFTSDYQPPAESKSRKGIKNSSTIARMVLATAVKFPDDLVEKVQQLFPNFTKETTGEIAATYMQLVKAVTDKDSVAYKSLLDSAYGAPKQEVEHSGSEENPIKFTITKTYAPEHKPDEGI